MQFHPHKYQQYAIEWILTHPVAALFLDMGLGKTAITLTALEHLLHNMFAIQQVLVVAPLRVARDTWPAEITKWDHLAHLSVAVAVGSPAERVRALEAGADITIINRENVDWMVNESGVDLARFDCLVIDELSSFKSPAAKRFKTLRKLRPQFERVIGRPTA